MPRPDLALVEDREVPPALPRELWSEGAKSVTDAAAFLGCSRKHVFELMRLGTLPWGRFGRRERRIPTRALVDYLAGASR